MNVTDELIKRWAIERDLHNADPAKQILKLGEEYGELCEFITKDRKLATAKDAIGDMYVVLVILCLQLDINIDDCIKTAYEEIKDRQGKIVNGAFVKVSDLD